jgi:2-dehydro-3-deoxygluconokinase
MPAWDVTAFGEAMLRLSVPEGERLEAAAALRVEVAGAESNVCAALAQMGRRTAWMGALPDNPLGRRLIAELRAFGVNTEMVALRQDGRLGMMFVEYAGPPRATQVVYDRAHSVAAAMTPEMLPWDSLLDTRMLHLTGITPALSASAHACVQEARRRAAAAGVPVSFDINYRSRLWDSASAGKALHELGQGAAVLFCKETDARLLFGADGDRELIPARLSALFQAQMVVMTCGEDGVYGLEQGRLHHVPAMKVRMIDRIGAGDAMTAGVLHGLLNGDFHHGLRCGAVLAALALSQHGDMVRTHPAEVAALLQNPTAQIMR